MFIIEDALPPKLLNDVRYVLSKNLFESKFKWDVYNNPFESKLALPKENNITWPFRDVFALLNCNAMLQLVSSYFCVPNLQLDETQYTTAVFVYREGHFLKTHLDAGIHNKRRKAVVLCLYLSECEGGEFFLGRQTVAPKFNTLIAFENSDHAYHGVLPVISGERIVVTTSYFFSDSDQSAHRNFTNPLERAYFIPMPYNEKWDSEMYALRDERAGLKPGWTAV